MGYMIGKGIYDDNGCYDPIASAYSRWGMSYKPYALLERVSFAKEHPDQVNINNTTIRRIASEIIAS